MHYLHHSDAELIHEFIHGQDQALEVLINRYKDKVYTSVFMLVKDKYLAEDIFQDAFLKMIKTIKEGRYAEQGKFLPWAIRVAHNLCMDHFRRNKRMPAIVDSDGKDILNVLRFADESREDTVMREQTIKQIKDMVELLPADQKEVLILRHYADLSFKEIAEMTGTNINTALGRMRYALLNLRKMIGEKAIVM